MARRAPPLYDKDIVSVHVHRAITSGALRHPRGMACADCGGAAVEYEHRDYNEPLRVEPICRRCNLRRGPAIPIRGSFARLVNLGLRPYRNRHPVQRILVALGHDESVLDGYPNKLSIEHWRELVHLFPA